MSHNYLVNLFQTRIQYIHQKLFKDCISINVLLIILISGVSYFWGFWDDSMQSLTAHDEGLYVGRARLILKNDDWFAPFSEPHHKTVGSYWLIALFIRLFGFSEYTVRFPSSIFSIFCSVLVYFIAKKFLSEIASLFSSLVLISNQKLYFICLV